MKRHPTQTSRKIQMERVKTEIIKVGGWIKVQNAITEQTFCYYIADMLDCTYSKAREYITQAVQGGLARANIEKFLADKARDK